MSDGSKAALVLFAMAAAVICYVGLTWWVEGGHAAFGVFLGCMMAVAIGLFGGACIK